MVIEKLYPFGFAEYIQAKFQKSLPENLAQRIKEALFFSKNAQEVHEKLTKDTTQVNTFWAGIERFEIDRYFKYGNLPFALNVSSEQLIYQQIQKIMDDMITKDITQLNAFDKQTLNKLSQLLYAIAGADIVSVPKLSAIIDLDPKTVIQALDSFEKTEVLLRVYPYGAHYSQVKKPSKYLFTSSAYRAMYYNLVGSVEHYDQYKGKLLEDVCGMSLFRLFANTIGVSITYDSAEGGADFIFSTSPQKGKIVLEVGSGRKGFEQVVSTLKKVEGKYGVVISQTELFLQREENCISVPLAYFLLI
jgi:predicted AAA+ superfamily ATPase